MIKEALFRFAQIIIPPTDREHQYMDFDSNLDLLWVSLGRDTAHRAVCATALLRRGATWCKGLGADRKLVIDFVESSLDDNGACDITQAEKIWRDVEEKNSAQKNQEEDRNYGQEDTPINHSR